MTAPRREAMGPGLGGRPLEMRGPGVCHESHRGSVPTGDSQVKRTAAIETRNPLCIETVGQAVLRTLHHTEAQNSIREAPANHGYRVHMYAHSARIN